MLSLGQLLPSVVTPRSLKVFFIEIGSCLSKFLQLPFDPRGDI